jgi:hypothetical protein
VLFSTVQGLGSQSDALEDDADTIHAVWSLLPEPLRESVRVVEGYVSPQRCIELIGSMRALVSMRMHPVLIGLSLGVPSLLVGTPAKASDFIEMGMGQATLDAEIGDPATLARCELMWQGTTGRGRALWDGISVARHRAAMNDLVIEALLRAAGTRASLRAVEA